MVLAEKSIQKGLEDKSEDDLQAICRMTLSIARVSGRVKDLGKHSSSLGASYYCSHNRAKANIKGFQFYNDSITAGTHTYRISEKKWWWLRPGQTLFEVTANNGFHNMKVNTYISGDWEGQLEKIHDEYGFGDPYSKSNF